MRLKRLYDREAPKKEWGERVETCPTCKGKGVVVNQSRTGVDQCPAGCEAGRLVTKVPPVSGVQVLHAGPEQHFSPNFLEGGMKESWLSMDTDQITIHGADGDLVYKVLRTPGRYGDEVIHYYDCKKLKGA